MRASAPAQQTTTSGRWHVGGLALRYEVGEFPMVWDADDRDVGEPPSIACVVSAEAPVACAGLSDQTAAQVAAQVAAETVPSIATRFDLTTQSGVTRLRQIAHTLESAPRNAWFCENIACADAARDQGEWAEAANAYQRALALFPLHWGYCIQYAHTVKEQGQFEQAEVWYRSAVALGAPRTMVDQHLAYVARRNGVEFVRRGMPELDVAPMSAPPSMHDILLLGGLMRIGGLADDRLVLDLLRHVPDNRALFLRMLGMPGFGRNNRDFLAIVRGAHA